MWRSAGVGRARRIIRQSSRSGCLWIMCGCFSNNWAEPSSHFRPLGRKMQTLTVLRQKIKLSNNFLSKFNNMKTRSNIFYVVLFLVSACSCNKNGSTPHQPAQPDGTTGSVTSPVAFWLTNPDMSVLLQKQKTPLNFSGGVAVQPVITVDTTTTYQQMDGFGYCLTGGSAQLIYGLPAPQRQALGQELVTTDST